MPTYQYACTACEHRFEAVQSFADPSLTECPECAGRLRKLFSGVGIVFKGSGFYRTDSRESAAKDASAKPDAAKAPAETGAAASSSTPKPSGDGASSESKASKPATTPTAA